MKKSAILLGVIIVLAVAVSPASAIIGGELDTAHHNVGAIVMYWPQFDVTGRLCTATLIHERVLVTAAHCYTYFYNQGIGYDEIWITFDQNAVAEDATYLAVEKFIPHPDFFMASIDTHDIALIVLEDPAPAGIVIEQLPDLNYVADVVDGNKRRRAIEFTVVGYGTSEYLTPPEIQVDAVRRNGTVIFSALLPYGIRSEPGDATLCHGDSGGPMFYVDKGREVLIGLYSRGGYDQCVSGGFHYRLDTTSAQDWINDTIAENVK